MSLFQQLEYEAFRAGITPRTRESREWFRNRVSGLTNINRKKLMTEEPIDLRTQIGVGKMYMYFYDPKHKATLPYYDRFPLIIMLDRTKNGFTGLNLHYLQPTQRAMLLDELLKFNTDKRYTENARINVTYNLLKRTAKLSYFAPCYKQYLTSHVRSKFAFVPPPEWEIATFLPTAQFEKASRSDIYKQSRKEVQAARKAARGLS